jgi:hypothetical protein
MIAGEAYRELAAYLIATSHLAEVEDLRCNPLIPSFLPGESGRNVNLPEMADAIIPQAHPPCEGLQ